MLGSLILIKARDALLSPFSQRFYQEDNSADPARNLVHVLLDPASNALISPAQDATVAAVTAAVNALAVTSTANAAQLATANNQATATTLLAAILTALGSSLHVGGTVNDAQSAPFSGAIAMMVGTTYAPQRAVGVLCSIAGNVEFALADGSTLTLPVNVGWEWEPYKFACAGIVAAGTTATASYYNLK